MPLSIVLLSGGLDSTVNLKCALDSGSAMALTFDYGQRAAKREKEAAAAMCARYDIPHQIIRLPWLARITDNALVDKNKSLPRPKIDRLDAPRAAKQNAASVWVPNRNGIFLSIAAAFAESLGANRIVAGFNAEEAATFPDNSLDFLRVFNRTLRFSTRARVRVKSYTIRKRKAGILRLGLHIHAPLDLIWCCYDGKRAMCGTCESCLRFLRAVERTGTIEWFRRNHKHLPRQLTSIPPER